MSLPFAIYKFSGVYSIDVPFRSRSFDIPFILTLKYLFLSYINSLTMFSGLLIHLPKINSLLMLLNFKPSLFGDFF